MAVLEDAEAVLAAKFAVMRLVLDERQWRVYLGTEARALGHGGIAAVARASGASETTVAAGAREAGDAQAAGALPAGRSRRAGAGRPRAEGTQPGLRQALEGLLEEGRRGDPVSEVTWSILSLRDIAGQMALRGFRVSKDTIAGLMHASGYSLQGMSRVLEGRQHPGRDGQFRRINARIAEYRAAGEPAISADGKKKEKLGAYHRDGRSWRPAGDPVQVRDHDFAEKDTVTITPYGVYDIAANRGFVSVGTSHDTSAFSVNAIRLWWKEEGQFRYPDARRLLVTCDAGGANGWRNRAWKAGLAQFAREAGLEITCCHFPPGTSKWNKIEHRLFSQITLNWRGRPLTSHDVIINTISAVTTRTGLTVTAVLDDGRYPTGTAVSDEQMNDIEDRALTRHRFHGEWNYTLLPVLRPAPDSRPEPAPGPAAAARAALAPVLLALASPELTGLPRQDLAALAASLELPAAAAREQRLHLDRGHSRQARTGPHSPFKYPVETQLLAAIYRHRLGMTCTCIGALLGAHHSTIGEAVQAITALLGPGHPALAPGPVRVRTPSDLRTYAATAGITIPDPPPRTRLRITQ